MWVFLIVRPSGQPPSVLCRNSCAYCRLPSLRSTASLPHIEYLSEWTVFKLLDTLRPTATGLDQLPSWFLGVGGAPFFCRPLTRLFNLSIATSIVPNQWKAAYTRPVPKVTTAESHTYFRPISITPVLSRMMEKTVVRHSSTSL